MDRNSFNCNFINTDKPMLGSNLIYPRMNLLCNKLRRVIACPNCKSPEIFFNKQTVKCGKCGTLYEVFFDTPVLVIKNSPVLRWYEPKEGSKSTPETVFKKIINKLYRYTKPADRVWTLKSQKVIRNMLNEKKPDAEDSIVVLIGTGFESVYKHVLNTYRDIIRIGLTQRGDVDLFCDVCDLPILDESIDLIFSSSVLEHVYNPERAVKEMFRVVKPGGYVYAEIPFMRAFHMIPIDYQRYTISGIEELFARYGFTKIDKGICSGPFTATVLFFTDFCNSVFSFNRYLRIIFVRLLSIVLYPVKYLDRFFENSKWAEVNACNFYYLGKKNAKNKKGIANTIR